MEGVCGEALSSEFARRFAAEEFADGADAVGVGDRGDIAGGFDAEDGNSASGVLFEQIAVVAGGFDDEAVLI